MMAGWVALASNLSILNHSYSVDWNQISIFWEDGSNGWNVDINVFNTDLQTWINLWTVSISDQHYIYTKQWDWDQQIWLIPDDGWDGVQFTIALDNSGHGSAAYTSEDVVRTVIPVTPKTWPSWHLIWIVIATFVVFGGYIFIKKQASL